MKGTKTLTTLQVGDIIRVKTNGIVYSYANESGNTEPDTAYAGDVLGEVTKITGSSVVFKDFSGKTRNTVSTGSIDFAANPDFDYSPVTDKPDTTTTVQKWLNFGFGIYDKIFNKSSTTGGIGTTGNNATGGTSEKPDPTDPPVVEKTFLEKYGLYGLGALVLGFIAYLIFGNKDKPQPQFAPMPPQQRPNLPQNQVQNQYQNVRL
jgi:hypothetical protein